MATVRPESSAASTTCTGTDYLTVGPYSDAAAKRFVLGKNGQLYDSICGKCYVPSSTGARARLVAANEHAFSTPCTGSTSQWTFTKSGASARNMGIVWGVVGGVIVLAAIVTLSVLIYRKNREG